jgi:hypothetical protein
MGMLKGSAPLRFTVTVELADPTGNGTLSAVTVTVTESPRSCSTPEAGVKANQALSLDTDHPTPTRPWLVRVKDVCESVASIVRSLDDDSTRGLKSATALRPTEADPISPMTCTAPRVTGSAMRSKSTVTPISTRDPPKVPSVGETEAHSGTAVTRQAPPATPPLLRKKLAVGDASLRERVSGEKDRTGVVWTGSSPHATTTDRRVATIPDRMGARTSRAPERGIG